MTSPQEKKSFCASCSFKPEVGCLSDDEDDGILPPEQPQKFVEHPRLEFHDLQKVKPPKLACVMMVKNEKKRIHVSLESATSTVCCYIIFDTGSEDDTKEIIIAHCRKNKKNLYMITGNFVNFSTSRNCVLDYADTVPVDFLLLLDCNDELRGGDGLLKFAKEEINKDNSAYLICQQWWSGQYDYYWNARLIKPRKKWRYICVVHEVLDSPDESFPTTRLPDGIIIYQDRTLDDDKTGKRFIKDKALLRREYRKNPRDGRTLFYLAQTYSCLKDWDCALRFYSERYEITDGFWEERFQSAFRAGNMCEKLDRSWDEANSWYLKAYTVCDRAEPLVAMAIHYKKEEVWSLSYLYARNACDLAFPEHCTLFIDKKCYDYERYQALGIVAFYYGKFADGKWACEKALEAKPGSELDKSNLKFYLDKEQEIKEMAGRAMTKNEYFKFRQQALKVAYPHMRPQQITTKIKLEWKTKNLKL